MKQPPAPIASPRPSACPGLWRIVDARDGGICRIKLPGGRLLAAQAQAVADAAERFAAGVIEATNRGNLQIRGIGSHHQGLVEHLLAAGLGPRDVAGDDVRNVMLSPLAGLDPTLLLDTRPLAGQVLRMLETTPRLHALSAKFAIQLDGGESLAMLEHPHDLWLSALTLDDRTWLAFGLAGCPRQALGAVPTEQGLALVRAVLARFLDLAGPEQSRMRQLLADYPVEPFIDGLGLDIRRDASVLGWRRAPVLDTWLGPLAQRHGVALGVAPPLGRLTPAMLRGIAGVARVSGDGSLRLSPWQSLVIPNLEPARIEQAQAALGGLGLICHTDHPLARFTACTGSSGCARALADTKADAQVLSSSLQAGRPGSVHLSGCPRSCAAAHIPPATLLARAPGRYDLYLRDECQPGFGRLRATDITPEEAGAMLDLLTEHLDD